jgi:hypothetical protein
MEKDESRLTISGRPPIKIEKHIGSQSKFVMHPMVSRRDLKYTATAPLEIIHLRARHLVILEVRGIIRVANARLGVHK